MAASSTQTSSDAEHSVTILDLLEHNITAHPTRPALRLARPNCPRDNLQWDEISYTQFYFDIQIVAQHWRGVLSSIHTGEAPLPGDTVTLWLPGIAYADILHQLALLALGYTVQMISHQPQTQQVLQLVTDTASKVLIAHPAFLSHEAAVQMCLPIPCFHPAASLLADISTGAIRSDGKDVDMLPHHPLPRIAKPKGSDVAFILHTSGTTSGRPKCIPITHDWIIYATKNFTIEDADDDDGHDGHDGGGKGEIVRSWLGNIAHVGTLIMLVGCIRLGGCLVQSHTYPLPAEELYQIATKAKLRRILTAGNIATRWIAAARLGNRQVLDALRIIRHIFYTGVGIDDVDRKFADEHGIVITSLWASTEAGPLLTSFPDLKNNDATTRHLLRPIHENTLVFQPRLPLGQPPLYELVVPATAPNVPVSRALCDEQGNFHTKDIFEEVQQGLYAFRGRADDFFKLSYGVEVRAAGLEADIKLASSDLVATCAVIGRGRDYISVVIEPTDATVVGNTTAETNLKQKILQQQLALNERRYGHERIFEMRQLAVVSPGSLPRSAVKGVVRRDAVEVAMPGVIDALFGVTTSTSSTKAS